MAAVESPTHIRGRQSKLSILTESAKVALQMLSAHKLRSFLTMLGVIIGVLAVSMIVVVQGGFKEYIKSQFDSLSADTIFIIYDPSGLGRGEGRGKFDAIDDEVRNYLMDRSTKIKAVTGIAMAPGQVVRWNDRNVKGADVTGIEPTYYLTVRREIKSGRYIEQKDVDELASVCMISTDLATELFGDVEPLGKVITMKGMSAEIVGTYLEPKQSLGPGNTKTIEMPVTTVQRKWVGGRSYAYLMAKPKDDVKVQDAVNELWELLMRKTNNKRVYRVESTEALLGILTGVIGVAGMVLASIAALSLLVGGIGIMNIMLVSVTERTKEIGLRMALGARRTVIMTQFLIEAAFLSLVGGLIGMTGAWLFGKGVTLLTARLHWPTEAGLATPFPWTSALGAAAFSAAIGMIFGFFPAMSAARLDPIVALRKE